MEKVVRKKLALLVGCNYANTPNELHGCINDVLAIREMLITRFGFEPCNIELLTDAHGSRVMPTGSKIKDALSHMVHEAEPGDVLYFHYSGHGTRIPSVKRGRPFHQDEAIVPCDFNLITDVDFRNLVNQLPKGASFTILSDSCHSGGLIDNEKQQIGPSYSSPPNFTISPTNATTKRKNIPFESLLHYLSSKTNINTSDIATHLLELFGDNASLSFSSRFLDQDSIFRSDNGILLSGCQANETCADINPHGNGEKAYGAFSNGVESVLKENVNGGDISNKKLALMVRNVLQKQQFEQHPCLYCSDENADASFLNHVA